MDFSAVATARSAVGKGLVSGLSLCGTRQEQNAELHCIEVPAFRGQLVSAPAPNIPCQHSSFLCRIGSAKVYKILIDDGVTVLAQTRPRPFAASFSGPQLLRTAFIYRRMILSAPAT